MREAKRAECVREGPALSGPNPDTHERRPGRSAPSGRNKVRPSQMGQGDLTNERIER